jgi:hypothetical protein
MSAQSSPVYNNTAPRPWGLRRGLNPRSGSSYLPITPL